MAAATLRKDEGLALIVALALHAGVIAWLALRPPAEPLPQPARMTVTLAEDVGLEATDPDPSADPAPDLGPSPGAAPAEPAAQPAPEPAPAPPMPSSVLPPRPEPAPPQPQPKAQPKPQPQPRAVPTPVTRPAPRPTPRATPSRRADPIAELLARRTPAERPAARPVARPAAQPAARPGTRPAAVTPARTGPAAAARPAPRPSQSAGGSRFADAFKGGIPAAAGTGRPAAAPSAQQQSAMRVSINRQVLGPWNACSVTGLDVEKLRARVEFSLDRTGNVTAIKDPVVTGITDSNRPQARRFGECAVRAIRTAAPYRLPGEFYDHWKSYRLNFEKRPS